MLFRSSNCALVTSSLIPSALSAYPPTLVDDAPLICETPKCSTLDEVVNWLLDMNYIPSFCTACYREGRTGDRFMSLCKSGQIANCCQPNALMTLKEYLEDYASDNTKQVGEELISKEVKKIPKDKVRNIVEERLVKISNGERDFRF